MRRPWRRDAKHIGPIPTAIPRLMELETAKEMLCGIFNARPADGLWSATFCLGE